MTSPSRGGGWSPVCPRLSDGLDMKNYHIGVGSQKIMNRMYDPCKLIFHSAEHLCADTFLSSTRSFRKKVLPASRRLGEAQKNMPFSRTDALSMISRSHHVEKTLQGCGCHRHVCRDVTRHLPGLAADPKPLIEMV